MHPRGTLRLHACHEVYPGLVGEGLDGPVAVEFGCHPCRLCSVRVPKWRSGRGGQGPPCAGAALHADTLPAVVHSRLPGCYALHPTQVPPLCLKAHLQQTQGLQVQAGGIPCTAASPACT